MSFRDDGEALRQRVDSLEDELVRTREEAERLRAERDRALAAPRSPAPPGVGAQVWVEWRGSWWAATILHDAGGGRFRIHYDGWSARWDETVGPDRMAPRDRPPPGRRGSGGPSLAVVMLGLVLAAIAAGAFVATRITAAASPPGAGVSVASSLRVGQPVWVLWSGTWYDATVLTTWGDTARIHYEGYGASFDEDVSMDRIRVGRE